MKKLFVIIGILTAIIIISIGLNFYLYQSDLSQTVKDTINLWLFYSIYFSIIFLLIICYIFPAIVSISNNHKYKILISILTLLLGWTIIGWIFILSWAYEERNYRAVKIIDTKKLEKSIKKFEKNRKSDKDILETIKIFKNQ